MKNLFQFENKFDSFPSVVKEDIIKRIIIFCMMLIFSMVICLLSANLQIFGVIIIPILLYGGIIVYHYYLFATDKVFKLSGICAGTEKVFKTLYFYIEVDNSIYRIKNSIKKIRKGTSVDVYFTISSMIEKKDENILLINSPLFVQIKKINIPDE